MQEIMLFLAPLAWLLPLVVAVVTRVRARYPKMDSLAVVAVSMLTGIVAAGISIFFPELPLFGKVAVAGLALGLSASGVYDLFSTFGTIHVKNSATVPTASDPIIGPPSA